MKNVFILYFLILITNLWSQNPFYLRIDKSVGLPSNSVYDIRQDQNGFMWFATNKGICKYDGTRFTSFSNPAQSNKAGSNLVEDSLGQMWYINFDGYIFHTKKDDLVSIPLKSSVGYMPFGILNKNLISVQKNKIVVKDFITYRTKKIFPLTPHPVITVFTTQNFTYILGNKLYQIDKNLKFRTFALPSSFNQRKSSCNMRAIGEKLYIFEKTGGQYFVFKNQEFEQHQIAEKNFLIQNISVIDNDIWLCSTAGLARLRNDKLEKFYQNTNIAYIFKDNAGNYWISALNEGLLLVSDFKKTMVPTFETPITLFQKNDNLFFGSISNGLWGYDIKKNQQILVSKNTNNHEIYLAKSFGEYSFTTASGFSVYDKQNNLLAFEPFAVKDVTPIDHKYFAMVASGFVAVFCLNDNIKSSWDDFYHKKPLTATSKSLKEFRIQESIKGKSVAYNSVNETIYFSTNEGLFMQTKTAFLELKYRNKDFFLNNISTYKNFIIGCTADGQFYTVDSDNTIVAMPIAGINPETINRFKLIKNNLYLFTDNEIFSFDLVAKKLEIVLTDNQNFDVSDIEFIDNKLVFATKKGLIIKENKATIAKELPKLILNKIVINDTEVYQKIPSKLTYDQNNLAFNFSVLNYNAETKYPISYSINNKKWYSLAENSKTLILNELSPADYTICFRIYDKNKTNFQEISTRFEIGKPFWKTFWFLMLLITIGFLFCYWVYRIQIKNIMKINAEKLEKSELETNYNKSKLKAIKSQMNPHFFYNALNTIQSYILSNDKRLALEYLSKFSNLTRTILEFSEKDLVSVSEEIETLTLYLDLEKARFDNNEMTFEIKTENIFDPEIIKIPSMLLQPYAENALKHGLLHKSGEKKLTVLFKKQDNLLIVTIQDNGIGREKSGFINKNKTNKRNSFATEAMTNRIDILNQQKDVKISIEIIDNKNIQNQSIGTTVLFHIPINS